jgi:hypothetical protein
LVLLSVPSSVSSRGVGSPRFNRWTRSSSICLVLKLRLLIEATNSSRVYARCTRRSCSELLLWLTILLDLMRHVSVRLVTIAGRWSSASTRTSLPMVSVHAHAAIL